MPTDLKAYETAVFTTRDAYQQAVKQGPASGAEAQLAHLDNLVRLHAAAIVAMREYLIEKFCVGRLSAEQYYQFTARVDAEEENHQLIHATALGRMGAAMLDGPSA